MLTDGPSSPRPTPRNICRRKLLTSTGITQHHHWPMMPRPIRTTGSAPFVRWGRTMSSLATALSAAIPTRSFGESSCATTIRVGRTEFRERYRVPGLRPMKTFERSRS
jgi:hypothetical protein